MIQVGQSEGIEGQSGPLEGLGAPGGISVGVAQHRRQGGLSGGFDNADQPFLGLTFQQEAALIPFAGPGEGSVIEQIPRRRLVFGDPLGQELDNVHTSRLRAPKLLRYRWRPDPKGGKFGREAQSG
jgi:hypothetical protein